MTTNIQHQIQADRSGKIWINVKSNDPRLNINGIVARIRPVYNHRYRIGLSCCVMGGIDGIHNTHCINDNFMQSVGKRL